MSFFPMVETFFFISLGISFLLIFLMVYHFKNRVDSLEQSNVALADICKTIVYEMETLKKTLYFSRSESLSQKFKTEEDEDEEDDEDEDKNEYENVLLPNRTILEEVYRNNNIGSSSAATLMMEMFRRSQLDEDDDAPISEDPCLYKKIVISDISLSPEEELNLSEWTEVVEEDEHQAVEDHDAVEEDEAVEDHDAIEAVKDHEEVEKVIDEMISEIEQGLEEEDLISELGPIDTQSTQSTKPIKNSPYQKMSVQILRTLVIQKGLCADPSKMKKLELIQLLL